MLGVRRAREQATLPAAREGATPLKPAASMAVSLRALRRSGCLVMLRRTY